ncbi:hypothetical protein D3C86_1536440 [compost metagenome]
MVSSPSIIGPVSKSMISLILLNNLVLLDILTTGAIGFPVGVPNPVVKSTILAPEPTSAVVDSTSLPGVQSKFKPGLVTFSG